MNSKDKWCYVFIDLPNDDRNVMVCAEGYPDIMIGFYLKDRAEWHVCDKEVDKDLNVVCWMDLPEKPKKYEGELSFRKADEARYITANAKKITENNVILKDFFYVRSQIVKAASNGFNFCFIEAIHFTTEISEKLTDVGYNVEYINDNECPLWKIEW